MFYGVLMVIGAVAIVGIVGILAPARMGAAPQATQATGQNTNMGGEGWWSYSQHHSNTTNRTVRTPVRVVRYPPPSTHSVTLSVNGRYYTLRQGQHIRVTSPNNMTNISVMSIR